MYLRTDPFYLGPHPRGTTLTYPGVPFRPISGNHPALPLGHQPAPTPRYQPHPTPGAQPCTTIGVPPHPIHRATHHPTSWAPPRPIPWYHPAPLPGSFTPLGCCYPVRMQHKVIPRVPMLLAVTKSKFSVQTHSRGPQTVTLEYTRPRRSDTAYRVLKLDSSNSSLADRLAQAGRGIHHITVTDRLPRRL